MIIGIGEILWDLFPQGKQLGGAPANFVYHMAQFGFDSRVISAIGFDQLGDELIDNLNKKHVVHSLARVKQPTGTVQVSTDNSGIPSYEICEPVAWDFISTEGFSQHMIDQTALVCFGTLAQRNEVSRRSIVDLLARVPAGAMKVFDINLRQEFYSLEIIQSSLELCNVLKINDDEILILAQMMDLNQYNELEICRYLLDTYQLRFVVLTKGAEGSYVLSDVVTSYMPTPTVEVADTVGAGDAFTAAFFAGILQHKTIIDAHAQAVAVAAYVCTQPGAMPDMNLS